MRQLNLFKEKRETKKDKGSLYLLKLNNEVNYSEKTFEGFRDIVGDSEDIYPGIDKWFNKKVIPGIEKGQRIAYLIMNEGKAIAETIIKRDYDTKLCSMRIIPEYQNNHLGPVLFAQIANSLDTFAETIHFTAPESLALERFGLFNKLGFSKISKSKKKYRNGEDEFIFKANTRAFKKKAYDLLSNLSFDLLDNSNDLIPIVLSIKPKYAGLIIKKRKTVEIRRKFSRKKLKGTTVFIYASRPEQCIMGEARISSVIEEKPDVIWDLFNDKIGCSHFEYFSYCGDLKKVNAVILEDIRPYDIPMPWAVFTSTFDAPIRPPQSYQFLKPFGFIPEVANEFVE
jgi:predicted transcriptional regulator